VNAVILLGGRFKPVVQVFRRRADGGARCVIFWATTSADASPGGGTSAKSAKLFLLIVAPHTSRPLQVALKSLKGRVGVDCVGLAQ